MKRSLLLLLTVAATVILSAQLSNYLQHAAGGKGQQRDLIADQFPVNSEYSSPGDRHKLALSDRSAVEELQARGGRLIGDYESFAIVEVDSVTAKEMTGSGRAQARDEYNLVLLNAGAIDTTTHEAQSLSTQSVSSDSSESRMQLIQFAGPIKPEWYESMVNTGVEVVTYIPNNAYLVYGDSKSLKRLATFARSSRAVQWNSEYRDEYKITPDHAAQKTKGGIQTQGGAEPGKSLYAVQLIKDTKTNINAFTIAIIQNAAKEPFTNQYEILKYINIIVNLTPDGLKAVSGRPDVVSIQPYAIPKLRDERQDQIMAGNLTGSAPTAADYMAYLAGKGFTQAQFNASNFAVDVSDDGLDNGLTNVNNPFLHEGGLTANASRVVYNRLENSGGPVTPGRTGFEGHGNLNTHIVGGFIPFAFGSGFPHADAAGFRFGLGIAPFVKVGHSGIFNPGFTNPNFANLQSRAYADGARISSNSWGASTGGAYTVDSQAYDALVRDAQPAGSVNPTAGNQEMVIVFAAGNDGSGANTVGSPGNGKNVICVGAAENVHSHSTANGGDSAAGNDGCGVPDTGANSANDIIAFSSRGPCDDGRIKPDIVGPGTHVTGGVAQQAPPQPPNGLAIATFNANSVCALSLSGGAGNPSNFFPLGQQWYTTSSGTSHSTPAVSGEAALIRQHFINLSLTPPSPAMTKAALMHSARYMNGVGANDTLPSNSQGMGEVNMNSFFDIFAVSNILRDQIGGDTFTASGQQRVFTGNVVDAGRPFRVTLAWTDPPGPTSGNAFINNLDLEVTVGGNTYKGNVFTGANSVTGGVADTRNNVECVFVPAGVTGPFVVKVIATNIAGDGVPNSGGALDQDFALIVCNAQQASQAVIASAGATLQTESCTPPNGVLDPNEQVTVSFCVQNVGNLNTTNLVGTLQNTGGVTSAGGPQTYGAVVAGGPAVCKTFSFIVGNVACGSVITATIQFQDGATNLGSVTYTFQTGILQTVFQENFDGVTAPALPAGWTTSFTNGDGDCTVGGPLCTLGTNWTTVNTSSDTAPNSAFHNDPSCVTDSFLVSPTFMTPVTNPQLMFRHNFNTESTFDGGVLEISINGGAFNDVGAASFVSGGYNGTISGTFLSPIANRQAWTGNSGGFQTVVCNLPATAGQNVQLRWRMASDCSVSATGWNVDTIKITGGFLCSTNCPAPTCTGLTCPANIIKSNDPNQCGAVVTYPAPTPNGSGCGTINCSPASGSFFPKGTTTVTCTASGAPGSPCTFTVTVNDTQPPTITCPSNVTAITPTIGGTSVVVTYPPPTASDNCPGVTAACNPPSGSSFPVGCTTVTCTATDTSNNTATCSFQVCVFNICLQDDSNPASRVVANTVTGDYRFCCGGVTYTGKGKVTIQGNTFLIEHNTLDRRVRISATGPSNNGNASLQSPPGKIRCVITDSDVRNNTTCSTCQ